MNDNYRLTIKWDEAPGLQRSPVEMTAPSTMIAAALKELCTSSFALTGLSDLRVQRA